MRRSIVLAAVVFAIWGGRASGAADLAEAARAIDDGVPEVAVARLQPWLPGLTGDEANDAKQKLAEALIAAKRPASALTLLQDPSLTHSPNAQFLRAQALADLGRFEDAMTSYRQAAAVDNPQQRPAMFGCAEMLRALGRTDEAIRQYHGLEIDPRFGVGARLREAELLIVKRDKTMSKRLLDQTRAKTIADRRQKRLLRGRLELLNQRPDRAVQLLEPIAKSPQGESHDTVIAALITIADAHLQMNIPESGDDYLETFIDKHPADTELPRLFSKLEQLYRAERRIPRNELEKWSRDSAQPRRALAQWYLAQIEWRAGRRDDAIRRFEEIRHVSHPMLVPAILQYAQLLLDGGRPDDALAVLHDADRSQPDGKIREQIRFERARALYARAEFAQAGAGFEQVANNSPNLASPARFNAALAWLRAGDSNQLAIDTKELATGGNNADQPQILLETALNAAQRNDKKAPALLRDFVRRFPDLPGVSDAYLALAEIAYHSVPPNLDETGKNLAAARAVHPSEAVTERADYLAIWLADAKGSETDQVITAANTFLQAHPKSSLTGDVRLKLAETHFRRQDFANAQTQFELLAQENPTSPLTEKALFLAAQSAMATMTNRSNDRALELLAQVVKINGDLRWAARNEQAAIERRLGKPQEAQLVYDEVLKGDARGGEKREALCGKADTFLEQANTDTGNLPRAIQAYDQLASEAANQPHWRNQALCKKGICQEKQSDDEGALSTFYKVLEFNPDPGKPPEFFWFYKAGFNAARLLEEQQKWDSAAAIYEKLVAAKGPRSDEAKGRLDQLRLEHFLWQ